MTIKIKWKVDPLPVGRYSSFQRRGWPAAEYADGRICAAVHCEDEYTAKRANGIEPHKSLVLRFADYSTTPWKWRKFSSTFFSLSQIKMFLPKFFERHPEYLPEDLRP